MTQSIDTSPAKLRELAKDLREFLHLPAVGDVFLALAAEKEALQAQEPVAWMHYQGNHAEPATREFDEFERARGWTQSPLYLAPQPLPQQVERVDVPLPEPLLEGVEYELWGQNRQADVWDEPRLRNYAQAYADAVVAGMKGTT